MRPAQAHLGAQTGDPTSSCRDIREMPEKPKPVYAEPGQARVQARRMVWPIVCRRLEEFPNINAMQLFEELCVRFPGRVTRKQYKTLVRLVSLWRQEARARGVVIGPKAYRRLSDKPRGRRPISLGSIGKRWPGALKSSRIKPRSNFSSSSRPVTRENTVRDSFTRCRDECGRGADKRCSGLLARSAAYRHTSLRIPHVRLPVTSLVRQPVTELREATRQQSISSMMLQYGRTYPGKKTWGTRYHRWLEAQHFDHPAQQLVFQEIILGAQHAMEQLRRIEDAIIEFLPDWSLAPFVGALQALRGVRPVTAATMVVELGDLRWYERPRQLMDYIGLVPGERSTGDSVRRLGITKAGNARVRRILRRSRMELSPFAADQHAEALRARTCLACHPRYHNESPGSAVRALSGASRPWQEVNGRYHCHRT